MHSAAKANLTTCFKEQQLWPNRIPHAITRNTREVKEEENNDEE